MSYIALKLARRSAMDIVSFGYYVHDEMVANVATFASPPVLMTALKTHIDELLNAEVGTQKKTPASYTLRDQKRSVVELDLNQLGYYVSELSKGDILIIQKAGMEPRKQPSKLTELEDPMILEIDNTISNQLSLKCNKVDRAVNYVFEHTDDFQIGIWRNGTYSTSTKATITGLTSGKEYWVRVRALGTNEVKSEWSDPIVKLVT